MSEDTLLTPIKLEGKEFYEEKEFYDSRTDKALRNLQNEGYKALFMPSIIDARIEAPDNARIWKTFYSAPSTRVTGRTKQGNPVVVYAHIHNYFSEHNNITKAIENGLVNGAGVMPQKEFYKIVDLDGVKDSQENQLVWVVDYEKLKNSTSAVIQVEEALGHPQTIPFLGGEERAQKYLKRHKGVYGNQIGIWHSDDLGNQPLGRLLFVGCSFDVGLGGGGLRGGGRFVGVRAEVAPQILQPNLEQILKQK